jgi:Fe-S-cluster containining protein
MAVLSKGRRRLLHRADRWFFRARAALLGEIPCRRGCCRCCIGPFPITIADLTELQNGLASLEESIRRAIEAKARGQAAEMEAVFPRLAESPFLDGWSDDEVDRLVERFADRPCPALGPDGDCRIYAFRPLTCRTMGIPVEVNGALEGACSVQIAIPIVRLPRSLREEERALAEHEAAEIDFLQQASPLAEEEVLLPYGFLDDRLPAR